MNKLSYEDERERNILGLITRFIKENYVETGNYELDYALNSLIKGMPEFINIIGKKQHGGHKFTLDVHILSVLQKAMKNPEYKNLSKKEQFCLKFTAILHDIAKPEGVKDDSHAEICALYARDILNKENMRIPNFIKDRIFELVKNHHWLTEYNKNKTTPQEVAVIFRRDGDLKISQILSEADIKSIDGSDSSYSSFLDGLRREKQMPVKEKLSRINESGQLFFVNKLEKPEKVPIVQHKGKEYRVINFTLLDKNADLSQFGFERGTTADNLRMFVHTVSGYELNKLESAYHLSDPHNQGLLCASYVSVENHPTYCNNKFGVSLVSENVNIANADTVNQGSGCGKSFSEFSQILTNNRRRNFISDSIKETLSLSNSEYSELYSTIQKYKSANWLGQVKTIKVGDRVFSGKEIKDAIIKAGDLMMSNGGSVSRHNEANLYNPKTNAVIAKVNSMDEMPDELLDFAQRHNLPIYILGE